MFGFRHSAPEDKDDKKERKPVLTERERMLVYIGATAVLVIAALVSILTQTAVQAGGAKSCAGIILQQQRDSCYSQIAVLQKNSTTCAQIANINGRYSCIATVAESLSSASICNGINSTNYLYANCILNITKRTGSIAYCSMLHAPLASSCIYSVAVQQKFSNISTCYSIANSTLMGSCIGAHYYDVAVMHGSASTCDLVPNASSPSVLGAILSQGGNLSNPEQYLVYSSINISPRSYCYFKIATLTYNKSICSSTTGILSTICNDTLAHVNASSSYSLSTACNSVPGYLQGLCSLGLDTQLALTSKNVSYCNALQTSSYRYSCISTLAAKLGNSSYCSYIANATQSQACVVSAVAKPNSTHT